ncbi:hypothetical protein ASPWEDRAFT_453306 [Aspergillus wentii DTO 134E9]|uniref:Box C/D snoRNA protein 1 n=1 Tax=Aspergillus wentii DTO 134E9 TaxID=1073089 RepID=A0A1L9RRD0_ASPWE|nr:uncharacterized protein ASPWEDRAFT_453306 [Aspergillus wentii DTO 134E9]KAI9928088.1 Box C/D snoRNA protein 1 [Aspergillus wentii]OJJ37433.1 hypothetical protein ASPWEDRAFT_453306 [Aspergillus wentii DTO 134E9]
MSDNPEDTLLSDLCTICHVNAPKYRCPRCSTRTCSLPCSRRHKLWSQCSGVRDPAAYLKRNELATPSAFDRDFNFITGIERRIERADRDAENRGVPLDHGAQEGDGEDGPGSKKRKRPQEGFVRGEAGFLRGAENGGVTVIRAPKGMTRNKLNSSRWHPKQKCLNWAVEWITADGAKTMRNCLESCSIANAYDRFTPLPKPGKTSQDQDQQRQPPNDDSPGQNKPTQQEAQSSEQPVISSDQQPEEAAIAPKQPEQAAQPSVPPSQTSHRDLYFYLHRPRTSTKQPVLVPLLPTATLGDSLRKRTVLEFPSIYALPESPETLRAIQEQPRFILEETYLAEHPDEELELVKTITTETDNEVNEGNLPGVDLGQVDENKVLEVLKQDLFEPVSETPTQ